MGTWSCSYCTLHNDNKTPQCNACGAQNPTSFAKQQRKSFLPKVITKPIEDISNAVIDIFSYSRDGPVGPTAPPQIPVYPPIHQVLVPGPPVPPPRPAPPRPQPPQFPTTSQGPALEYSGTWVCKQCYKANELTLTACSGCACNRKIGAKTRQRTKRHGSIQNPSMDGFLCSEVMATVEQSDAANALALYNNVIQICRQHNVPFIDDQFPHTTASIGQIRRNAQDAVVGELPTAFVWCRPQEIYTKDGRRFNWSVFRDPQPSDIEQGVLGDCWLLSAMALIAERPDVLEHIILTKEYTSVGAYQIRICIDGEWKVILVDDFFPCRTNSKALAFATGRKNQLWVPLIEKALAKQFESYAKLVGGRTIEGLAMLTGAPTEQIIVEREGDSHKMDLLWVRLLSAKEASFVMGCSCGSGNRFVDHDLYKAKGLLTQHAYSILDVRQEGVHRLIRLRNPWGSFVWQGAWSDNWPKWDPALKQRLLGGEYQSGSFWMSFDDFLEHFDSVDIAKLRSHSGWAELRMPIKMGRVQGEWDSSVRFFVEDSTELCFTLFQSGARTLPDKVDLMVCVHRINSAGVVGELICRSDRKIEAFTSTGDTFLSSGEYVVICHSLSTLGARKINGCLVIHSSREVYADTISCKAEMYTDSLIQLCLKEAQVHQSLPGVVPRYLTDGFAGLMLLVDNLSENRWVHVKTECAGSVNVLSSRGAMNVSDVVPPLSRQIVVILTHFEPSNSFIVQHKLEVSIGRRALLEEGLPHSPMFNSRVQSDLHNPKSVLI